MSDNLKLKKLKRAILPKGFSVAGLHCGIKKSKQKDLGLVYSDYPCTCAGMFTANKVKAASLQVCVQQLKDTKEARAIIVNSGNANCFVGSRGKQDALAIIKTIANKLGIFKKGILIASTGVIGRPLPLERIRQAIPKLCGILHEGGLDDFADSILTTDTFRKIVCVKLRIKNKPIIITGIAKGAGMIYPRLEKKSRHATMLAFILTDVAIRKELFELALENAMEDSFNSISVDGCMSTNDTVLALANGVAKNTFIAKQDRYLDLFCSALSYICGILAKMIIVDAEGATKQIEIFINGARHKREAVSAANAVANSNLFKAAMFGENPNWGRIVAAIGAAGVAVDENRIDISFNRHKVFHKGKVYPCPKRALSSSMLLIDVNLNRGKATKSVITSDLTPKYVRINAAYN